MSSTEQLDNVVKLARKLVSIPSVNPMLADDPATAGEQKLADFVGEHLAATGFAVEFREEIQGRPNVIATYGPTVPARRLIIEAHLDTQGIHGMTVPPFDGLIKDNRMYGRGACDMKGPMAAAMATLTKERIDRLAESGVQVQFIGAIGEETGNIGANQLVEQDVGADEILVLEPTDLHVVHAHKGVFWFEVEINGIAAHGSNPSSGRSAVRGAGQFIERLYQATESLRIENKLLGKPTINVGIIRGGTSINIVPERCVLECDRRMVPGESSSEIADAARDIVNELVEQDVIVSGNVIASKEGVPFETTADSSLVKRLSSAIADNGVAPVSEGVAWYSDAGPFSRTCKEVCVFGPGSIRQAHTADEFIDVTELQKGEAIIASFLDKLADEVKAS